MSAESVMFLSVFLLLFILVLMTGILSHGCCCCCCCCSSESRGYEESGNYIPTSKICPRHLHHQRRHQRVDSLTPVFISALKKSCNANNNNNNNHREISSMKKHQHVVVVQPADFAKEYMI